MQPDDFTFSMLARAIQDAGGRVHVPCADVVRLNSSALINLEPDGQGGVYLTISDRNDTCPLDETLTRIHQDEGR